MFRNLLNMCVSLTLAVFTASAQVEVDRTFNTRVSAPMFATGNGPLVLIDEAHQNAHTFSGRYAPFANLLQSDGFRVEPLKEPLTSTNWTKAAIVVIANASATRTPPIVNFPVVSAFEPNEIERLRKWVENGGSLLLIADHPPWAGATESLAKPFGISFFNGYAMREADRFENFVFRTSDGSLVHNAITRGRRRSEKIEFVVTFTGQAFLAPAFDPLICIPDGVSLFIPERAGALTATTPRINAGSMLQGAIRKYGRGRVAVFGEAAMFTAQFLGKDRTPLGMNHPDAAQNKQFILNVAHWLVRRL